MTTPTPGPSAHLLDTVKGLLDGFPPYDPEILFDHADWPQRLGWVTEDVECGHERWDPFTGQQVVLAPSRGVYEPTNSKRISWDDRLGSQRSCVFCSPEFRKSRRPLPRPEGFLLINNLYPYLDPPGLSHVSIYPADRHAELIAQISHEEFIRHADFILADLHDGSANIAFSNYGPNSTASVPHLHWQLLKTVVTPPAVTREVVLHKVYNDLLTRVVEYELAHQSRLLHVCPHWVAWMPWWTANLPMIVPGAGATRFSKGALGTAIHSVLTGLQRSGHDSASWWIHTAVDVPGFVEHVHLELNPKRVGAVNRASGLDPVFVLPHLAARSLAGHMDASCRLCS